MAETNYFWDEMEDNVIRSYDGSNNTIANYTTEPSRHGGVPSQERGGVTRYLHYDGLGNTTELTDDAGNVTDTRRYSAFGDITQATGSTVFEGQYAGNHGYWLESQLARYMVRRRWYSNTIARWFSADPIMRRRTYLYAENAPLTRVDPSGLLSITPKSSACSGCGAAEITWKVLRAGFAEAQIVQEICFSVYMLRCIRRVNGDCCPYRTFTCKICYFERLLSGDDDLDEKNDNWRIPNFPVHERECGKMGWGLITSTIKAFGLNEKLDAPWEKGPGLVPFCGLNIEAAPEFFVAAEEPPWWNNGRSVASAESFLFTAFDCCSDPPTSFMIYGTTKPLSIGYSACQDPVAPMDPRRPRE